MGNFKLSVLTRSIDLTGWHKSKNFDDSDIAKIPTLDSRSSKSLNAYPTPFARVHLIDDAFSLVLNDERYNTKNCSEAHKKLVSDCLDVFELMYNWNYHLKEGKLLSIDKWIKEEATAALQKEFIESKKKREQEVKSRGNNEETLILNEVKGYKENLVIGTLNLFMKEGIFADLDEIQIIKFNNKPIAGISPLTGFFTTPNALSNFEITNPLTRRAYFSKTILFKDRDEKIKKYIYDFISDTNIFDTKLAICRYLEFHREDVNKELELNLEDLKSTNKNIFDSKITLKSSKERSINDYFEPALIRLNYKLNSEYFYVPKTNQTIEQDYLLPLTKGFYEDFDIESLNSVLTFDEKDKNTVVVSLNKNGEILKKTYQKNVINPIDGQLIDLADTHSIKINLGIFPFVKVIDQERKEKAEFNNFYRLMFVHQDINYLFSNDDFEIRFGKNKSIIDPDKATTYQIEREDRTKLERDGAIVGSTYYGTNFCFDFIEINFPQINGVKARGLVFPKWKEKILGNKKIDFAVDFGTTSTFIAYKEEEQGTLPKSFELSSKQMPVALLNKPLDKKAEFDWIDCFEHFSLSNFTEFFEVQLQEFLPSLINNEKYNLPFRTAVFEKESIPAGKKKALLNSNIAFTYQKFINTTTNLNQDYLPNLKWNVKKDGKIKESVEVFLEEIFQLLKYKCILENGNPEKSFISWFYPLSFTGNAQFIYEELWRTKYNSIFKGNEKTQLRKITESEAPFYYYSAIQEDGSGAEKINDSSSVLTLDIGGGTTDLMYFRDNKSIIGSSIYFGANTLWGNGYSEFRNEKNNGIYKSLKDPINDLLKSTLLKSLNEKIQEEGSNYGSDEIINFWLLNNDVSKVSDYLNNGDFKLSYILHLSALIYHSLKLLSSKNHPAPTSIIFTGNGSKYLDLIQSKEYINKICNYFISEVYPDNATKPQIILPVSNRKEATCFGGLYQNEKAGFDAVTYLGFDNEGEDFKKYEQIEAKKEFVFGKISESFKDFLEIFFRMNENPELSFRSKFGIEANLNALKHFMISKSDTNLVLGYNNRKASSQDSDEITDSLFFYPIVGLIYQINKIKEKDLSEFVPKKMLYFSAPNKDGEFEISKISNVQKPDSIFRIVLNDDNQDIGKISIVEEKTAIQRAISGLNSFLKETCDFAEYPGDNERSIEVLETGEVFKKQDNWVVTKKILIHFCE